MMFSHADNIKNKPDEHCYAVLSCERNKSVNVERDMQKIEIFNKIIIYIKNNHADKLLDELAKHPENFELRTDWSIFLDHKALPKDLRIMDVEDLIANDICYIYVLEFSISQESLEEILAKRTTQWDNRKIVSPKKIETIKNILKENIRGVHIDYQHVTSEQWCRLKTIDLSISTRYRNGNCAIL